MNSTLTRQQLPQQTPAKQQLGLNEALITVERSHPLVVGPLEVNYQVDECFECPLEHLITLREQKVEDFAVSSQRHLRLELKSSISNLSCHLENLSLNDHGHYKIDVDQPLGPNASSLECFIRARDEGTCVLCPLAVVFFLVVTLTTLERIFASLFGGARKVAVGERSPPVAGESVGEAANSPAETDGRKVSARVECLDAFRGLTIAGMIMANLGGGGYAILQHSAWDGLTLADVVFPFFVFSMGSSIALSARAMRRRHRSLGGILARIVRRALVLLALGLCLNSRRLGSDGSLADLRLCGVLQRFAVSYLLVALLYLLEVALVDWCLRALASRGRWLAHAAGGLLELSALVTCVSLYLYVTFFLDYSNDCPRGYLGPGGLTESGRFASCTGGAAGWLDRLVLGERHMYDDLELKQLFKTRARFDPEGLLGISTSVVLTLVGLQSGKILVHLSSHRSRLLSFAFLAAALAGSCAAVVAIPVNKHLWSLTFVSLTGLLAYLTLALLYLALDVYGCRRHLCLRLLISAGKNALALYVGHSLVTNMLPWSFQVDETSRMQQLLRLVWSTFVWLLVAHYMAAKRIFIKV